MRPPARDRPPRRGPGRAARRFDGRRFALGGFGRRSFGPGRHNSGPGRERRSHAFRSWRAFGFLRRQRAPIDRHPRGGRAGRDDKRHRGRGCEDRHPMPRRGNGPTAADPVGQAGDQRIVLGARPIRDGVIKRGERARRRAEPADGEVRVERALLDGRKRPAAAAREQVVLTSMGRSHELTSRISLSSGLAWIRSRRTCFASRRRLRIVSAGRPTAAAISSMVKPNAA